MLDLARAELTTGCYEQPDKAAGSKTLTLCKKYRHLITGPSSQPLEIPSCLTQIYILKFGMIPDF